MFKRFIVILSVVGVVSIARADDLASNIMLMNNYNVRQNDDIWARIRAGFKLDHKETARVKYFERLYTKNPKSFSTLMANAKPYLYYLLTEIERRGEPTELIFIPGIESSYNPLVRRPDDAYAGMWQFVPMTGRRFNMLQNSSIDERRDIIKSSQSALNYLDYLHKVFQQWDIAIGAYNWGEGGMYRAILDSKQKIGDVNYADLNLRQITADYEIKIVALANIINNPSKFGVTLDDNPNQPYFAIVHPETTTTIAAIAQASKINGIAFERLNPQYKSTGYTLSEQNKVLLPLDNQTIYYASLGKTLPSTLPENNIQMAANTSQESAVVDNSPDPILEAANNFGKDADGPVSYSPKDTVAANAALDDLVSNLGSDSANNTSGASASNSKVNDASTAGTNPIASASSSQKNSYIVTSGDTLYSIAKRFNLSVNAIRERNNIPGNNLIVGQKLILKN